MIEADKYFHLIISAIVTFMILLIFEVTIVVPAMIGFILFTIYWEIRGEFEWGDIIANGVGMILGLLSAIAFLAAV